MAPCDGACYTTWTPSEEIKEHYPARHSDYRDSLPLDLKTVYQLYKPYVKNGRWTFGLFEMWFPKAKTVKHSVHIPCWDSFKVNPCLWRGVCFGRTVKQCFWTGMRQTRWARGVYSANLGREYIMPVLDISRHNKGFKSDIKALTIMYYAMATVMSCGIGQVFSLCGNACFNFAACYSCHSREKIRRKYKLPPIFGLPPGIDDFLVHLLCSYCASHQELRELAVRGVDGPGMHIMDVLPDAWDHLEGHEEVLAARRKVLGAMLAQPPKLFKPRIKSPVEAGAASEAALAAAVAVAELELAAVEAAERKAAGPKQIPVLIEQRERRQGLVRADSMFARSEASSSTEFLGWVQYRAPTQQGMDRGDMDQSAQELLAPGRLERSWSVAY